VLFQSAKSQLQVYGQVHQDTIASKSTNKGHSQYIGSASIHTVKPTSLLIFKVLYTSHVFQQLSIILKYVDHFQFIKNSEALIFSQYFFISSQVLLL